MRAPRIITAAAVAACAAQAAPAHASGGALTPSPGPGTPDASPQTQISLLGPGWRSVRAVTVTGSRSGPHAGHLRHYASAAGESFLPARPFLAGETVSVTVRRRGAGALRWSFTVATPGTLAVTQLPPGPDQSPMTQQFSSRADLHPPRLTVSGRSPAHEPGDLFLAPIAGPGPVGAPFRPPVGPAGPMIVDGAGNLVWFHPLTGGDVAMNLHPVRYRGHTVLSWWQGKVFSQGFGFGAEILADHAYRPVARIQTGNGYAAGPHEFQLTRSGTALLTAYVPITLDLASIGGSPRATVLDSLVQEVDATTGLVMYEWHSLGHVGLDETYVRPQPGPAPFDPWHVNSVQFLPHGRLLISERNTWAVYAVDTATGAIAWRLGGKRSSFTFGPGASFAWQHDARLAGDRLTLFDDEAAPPVAQQSRGLVLDLDRAAHRAGLARQYLQPGGALTGSQGNLQLLPDGNALVGWGAAPLVSEFSPGGRLLLGLRFPAPDETYRAYRMPWAGRPSDRPAVTVEPVSARTLQVNVSWNGATAVARWLVLGGGSPRRLAILARVPRAGFETSIGPLAGVRYLQVVAQSARGTALRRSAVLRAS